MLVDRELRVLGMVPIRIELGEVDLQSIPTALQLSRLRVRLHLSGLELMDNFRVKLIEKIKISVIEWVHYSDDIPHVKISKFLTEQIGKEYHYMSDVFSKATGITIEHFVITHKIERVKELLIYNQLSITEIAWKLNYSSVAHLSNQFKKITGLTPTAFKKMQDHRRATLESF
jgi:AraC-like DNA-binding protein